MSEHIDRLKNEHKDFDLNRDDSDLNRDPMVAFREWFDQACNSNEPEPNAFSLSTVDVHTFQPSSRIIYLKDLRKGEFVFYTNYKSEKGLQLEDSSFVSMLFFWPALQRQVRIQGEAHKISPEESDEYFKSRPRSSQLGAWASKQSEVLDSREDLKKHVEEMEARFPNEIPRPDFWGGYAVRPMLFEFWQGKPSRLHERHVYRLEDGNWKRSWKNP